MMKPYSKPYAVSTEASSFRREFVPIPHFLYSLSQQSRVPLLFRVEPLVERLGDSSTVGLRKRAVGEKGREAVWGDAT